MNDSFIKKLICLVEANLADENFGPKELAKEACMSHSNLNRKLRSFLNQNSSRFIREIRLKKAKELLQNENLTVAEISYHVGFGSPNYFNNCFHEYFGFSPGELRNQKSVNELDEKPYESMPIKSKRIKILIGLIISIIIFIPITFFIHKKLTKGKALRADKYYQIGKDRMNAHIFSIDKNEKEKALIDAKLNMEKAIELDSTFADAYSVLGSIYIINLFNKEAASNWDKASAYLDSGRVMLDKALFYDGYNQQALASKAAYYELKGRHAEANPIYESISKNGYLTFEFGISRYNSIDDYYGTINNYIRYIQSKPADIIVPPYILRMMIEVFRKTGFPELEKQLADQLLAFNNDTLEYFNSMVMLENWQGNYKAAIDCGLEVLKRDSVNDFCNLILGLHYAYLKDYSNAIKYIHTYDNINILKNGELQPNPIAGFVYLKNYEEKMAKYHLNGAIERWQTQIQFNTHTTQAFTYLFELADVYLALGEKEKANAFLKEMKKLKEIDRVLSPF